MPSNEEFFSFNPFADNRMNMVGKEIRDMMEPHCNPFAGIVLIVHPNKGIGRA